MIQKVLIAEDHESANISIQKTLSALNISDIDMVYYCDDALQQIARNLGNNTPYDLLITDLHFESDHRPQQLKGGLALIEAARKTQPGIKILVFSAEAQPATINRLFHTYEIDGYVRKARRDAEELQKAIAEIAQNRRHIPSQFAGMMRQQKAYQFTDFDITIISLLANGVAQKNIPSYLKHHNIQPSGLSSVEKRLKHIRETLQVAKNEQLVIQCKEIGII